MKAEEIQIPRSITNQILHLAQISPEQEVCGLIGSVNGIATNCYPIKNTAPQPEQRFLLDTQQQINAMASMRERNENLFAIYHSHPSAAATPSQTDLDLAAYPEALYLIISLNTKGLLELRGFRITANQSSEVVLSLQHDD